MRIAQFLILAEPLIVAGGEQGLILQYLDRSENAATGPAHSDTPRPVTAPAHGAQVSARVHDGVFDTQVP